MFWRTHTHMCVCVLTHSHTHMCVCVSVLRWISAKNCILSLWKIWQNLQIQVHDKQKLFEMFEIGLKQTLLADVWESETSFGFFRRLPHSAKYCNRLKTLQHNRGLRQHLDFVWKRHLDMIPEGLHRHSGCNTLHYTATQYNNLQHSTAHCNTL